MTRKNPKRRQELMNAAQHLFYTKGYEQTSINDIIKATGVSKGAFYHHFDSKSAILEGIVTKMMKQAVTELQEIIADDSLAAIPKWQKVVQLSLNWQLEKEAGVMEVGRILRSNENILLHHTLDIEWFKVSVPEITKIIEQGVSEGVFETEHIEETAVILLMVTNKLNEEMGELFANQNLITDPIAHAYQKLIAKQSIVERLLGASNGSMPLVDHESLSTWFKVKINETK